MNKYEIKNLINRKLGILEILKNEELTALATLELEGRVSVIDQEIVLQQKLEGAKHGRKKI